MDVGKEIFSKKKQNFCHVAAEYSAFWGEFTVAFPLASSFSID
jgi:hypothetical protein